MASRVALLALLIAAPGGAAEAEHGLPRIAVLPLALDPAVRGPLGQLAFAAEQSLDRSGRFDLIRPADALDPAAAKARRQALDDGDAAVAAGQKAYDDLDAQKALKDFDQALKEYEQTDLTRHLKPLSRAWSLRAAAMAANGDNKAADQELERLLAVDPRATLSSNFFPPELLAAADRFRRAAANGTGRLEVRTTPPGAQVYVDGHFAGIAPFTATGLAPGDHYFTALLAGYGLQQQRVKAGPVELTLKPAERTAMIQNAATAVSLDPDGPGRDLAAQRFGVDLGAEQVLLLLARRTTDPGQVRLVALRLEVRDGHNLAYLDAPLPVDASLLGRADAIFTGLATRDEPRQGGPLTHFAPKKSGRKKAGIALLVAGGALVVTGAIFAGVAASEHGTFRNTAQTDPNLSSLQSSGKTFAALADVGVIVGLLAGGGGAALTFLGGPPEASPAPPPRPITRDVPMPPPPAATPHEEPKKAAEPRPAEEPPRAEEKKKKDEPDKKRHDEDDKHKKDEAEKKKREEEDRKKKDDSDKKKKDEAEQKKHDDSERKREQDQVKAAEKKPPETPKKTDDDDLRNY